jgi:rubrerythrin
MFESDWEYWKKSDPEFEREVKSFLEHIGSCIHDFSLRVLPDPEPVRSSNESDHPQSTVSSIIDRSWPSGYLHVSHHTDTGLTDAELEKLRDHTHRDEVADFQRLQAWCESVQELEDQAPYWDAWYCSECGSLNCDWVDVCPVCGIGTM